MEHSIILCKLRSHYHCSNCGLLISNEKMVSGSGGVAQEVDHLPTKCEAQYH
jgi:hypothetical protein